MSETIRDSNGQFAPGTAPGPGRPKRAIEIDYARIMADAISLDDWRAICVKAVQDAKDGDCRAREFIAARLIGADPLPLMSLAIADLAQIGTDELISASAEVRADQSSAWPEPVDPLTRAITNRIKRANRAARLERDRLAEIQAAERRAKRAAAKATNGNG